MSGGAVSGNSASASFSDPGAVAAAGGGVLVQNGTFTMSGGVVSGNSSSSSSSSGAAGGGVFVGSGTFIMSGGAVSGNLLSGTGNYARETLVYGTFKISGSAWPERVFLTDNSRRIAISGSLSGGPVAVDLGGAITDWVGWPILCLDDSYPMGNMASLKDHFTLGNATLTQPPYTETPITGYGISDTGLLATAP